MQIKHLLMLIALVPVYAAAQLHIEKGAGVHLQKSAMISLQGEFNLDEDVDGGGTVVMNGTANQQLNANGYSLPVLQLENSFGSSLQSDLKIQDELALNSGRLILGGNNLGLAANAKISGSATAYILTGETGSVIKSVHEDMSGFMLPVGTNDGFAPLLLRSRGTYSDGQVKISAVATASPNKPGASKDYLQQYWTIDRSGINGELVATAFYSNHFTGNVENMIPYYWNGHEWLAKQSPIDQRNKLFSVTIPEGRGEIYAMRKGDGLSVPATSIQLSPNPVQHTARIMIRSANRENTMLRIIDNSGAVVFQKRLQLFQGVNQVSIDVSNLAKGHYVLQVPTHEKGMVTMIKQ